MSLVLVTGAPGWLGTRLVEVLRHGLPDLPVPERTVRCLVHDGAAPTSGVEVVAGDLLDPTSLERFFAGAAGATLFHAAGVIHPSGGTRQLFQVNVEGTRNLVAAAKRAGIARMVHVSSNSPLGVNPRPDHVFDEAAPYHPYLAYGRSKMLAEQIVDEAWRSGAFDTVIVRPPWFYGPGQPPRQSRFFRMVRDGKAPIVGGGQNRRSMAYIDNICQGLLLAERVAAARGQTYWIADRRPYTMNEVVDTIERVLEEDFAVPVAHRRLRLPGIASQVAEGVDRALQGLGRYHQKLHVLGELNKTIACSIAKAERELGYDPTVELREGMRRSIAWQLEHGGAL